MIAGRIGGEGWITEKLDIDLQHSVLSDIVLILKPRYEQMDSESAKARYIAAAFCFHQSPFF